MTEREGKKVWTRQAEVLFKRYLRTWDNTTVDQARACVEVIAYQDESEFVTDRHIARGLDAYNTFGSKGEQPFAAFEILLRPPYGYRAQALPEVDTTTLDTARMVAGEWDVT